MPRGRPRKKKPVEEELEKKTGAKVTDDTGTVVEETSGYKVVDADKAERLPETDKAAVNTHYEGSFKTTNMRVTDYLNKKGISPVFSYGQPMVFEYPSNKTKEIKRLLKEGGFE